MATKYEDRTKGELYDLAADRDIEGRSSMTKEELIAALRGETLEPEVVVEAEPEEEETVVAVESLSALQQAEYYHEQYDASGAMSDYVMWKQAENEHLG